MMYRSFRSGLAHKWNESDSYTNSRCITSMARHGRGGDLNYHHGWNCHRQILDDPYARMIVDCVCHFLRQLWKSRRCVLRFFEVVHVAF